MNKNFSVNNAVFLAVALLAVATMTNAASTYPTKPIRVIVPQSAGGSTDLAARVVTQRLSDMLGEPVIVRGQAGLPDGATVSVSAGAK